VGKQRESDENGLLMGGRGKLSDSQTPFATPFSRSTT
jgi:hypothetical protein